MEIILFVGIPIVLLVIITISIRNRLIGLKNKVEYANGAVDAMYKQRYDLIPNLVASVKQYMQHESGLLERLVELRSQGQSGNLSNQQKNEINGQLDNAIRSFNYRSRIIPTSKPANNLHVFSLR